MQFPRYIYKNGKLSPAPEDMILVSSPKEMLMASEEGFFSHKLEKAEQTKDIPCVIAYLDNLKKEEELREKEEEVIEKTMDISSGETVDAINERSFENSVPIEDQYKNSTGCDAHYTKGRYSGKETIKFKQWKKDHVN